MRIPTAKDGVPGKGSNADEEVAPRQGEHAQRAPGRCPWRAVSAYSPGARNEEPELTRSPSPARPWRRTLYAVAAGELLAVAGFTTSTPITPFFLQELEVTDPTG